MSNITTPEYNILNPLFEKFVDTATLPEKIADGYSWVEGPVWADNALYFSEIPSKHMWRWTPDAGVSVAISDTDFANGNTVDNNGHMITCEHGGRRVIRRLKNNDMNAVEVLADSYQGNRLNSPNDVVVKSDGSIWFTDPSYGIESAMQGYPADSEIGGCFVFCITPDNEIIAVATDFEKPNGLAFSPDEKTLYIADSAAILITFEIDKNRPHHIRAFDVDNHSLTNSRVFAEIDPGVPDGLRIDTEGYVWTSFGDGVECYAPDGEKIGQILVGHASNCCFGGADGTDLFITATDKVYRIRTTRRDARSLTNSYV